MNNQIIMERHWCMPNPNTFTIKPIREMLAKEIEGFSVDPFCRASEICTINSDINYKYGDLQHSAIDMLGCFKDEEVDTVVYDPPYSPRQVSECYKEAGVEVTNLTTSARFWSSVKNEIARVTHKGSKVISFGWNSGGIGKTRGFEIEKIILIPHGGNHNDTIVTIERKITEDKIHTPIRHCYVPNDEHTLCTNCGFGVNPELYKFKIYNEDGK